MDKENTIRYLKQYEIDKKQWDNCIDSSANGLIYAYSYYLDHMADNWDALVFNDYETVMPLPWRKKYGIHYLYQPFLTAQLGVFGSSLHQDKIRQFLDAIPDKFKLWEFSLNQGNLFHIPDYHLYERKNFILHLNESYAKLYSNYRENSKRNNKKALQYGCYPSNDIHISHVIDLVRQQPGKISEDELTRFTNLYYHLKAKNLAKVYGISGKDGQLLSSCVFFFSHKRAYYILVGNHPNGRTLGASHALIDSFIQEHAGQDLLLDFEGSDMRNLAFFYSSFGATEEKYTGIKRNMLPWYVRLFKK